MRALEFKSKIKNNQIYIPASLQSELKTDKDIRVILLIDDSINDDELVFQDTTTDSF